MIHIKRVQKDDSSDEEDVKKSKTATDFQRLKLDRLLKNIDKPAPIPAPKKERGPPPPPQFVRNVVGSSAGAGSGEYHIYRNLRKREMARQDYIDKKAKKDEAAQEFRERIQAHREDADLRTAKNRAKRLRKRRQRQKAKNDNSSDSGTDDDVNHPALAALRALEQEADASNTSPEPAAEPLNPALSQPADSPKAVDSSNPLRSSGTSPRSSGSVIMADNNSSGTENDRVVITHVEKTAANSSVTSCEVAPVAPDVTITADSVEAKCALEIGGATENAAR